jgi:hypothetical protein
MYAGLIRLMDDGGKYQIVRNQDLRIRKSVSDNM